MNDNIHTMLNDEGVFTIAIANETQRNALNLTIGRALIDAVEHAAVMGATAIVLTGEGTAFCSGANLNELREIVCNNPEKRAPQLYEVYQGIQRAILGSTIPVVAAVNGAAIGAGADMALACDAVLMADEAFLMWGWSRIGLVPGMGGATLLAQTVGWYRAAHLLLRAPAVGSVEAVEFGIAEQCCPAEELQSCAVASARRRAAEPRFSNNDTIRYNIDMQMLTTEFDHLARTQDGLLHSKEFLSLSAQILSRV